MNWEGTGEEWNTVGRETLRGRLSSGWDQPVCCI